MIKNNPKISVIVPIYNAEKYLHRCIDSILNQTFTDFEVLLINDGSTDSSGSICDEYAKKDSRVRVFHKENGGVSLARNIGIDKALGLWTLFVDSDDWLDLGTFSLIVNENQTANADLYHFGYRQIVKQSSRDFFSKKGDFSVENFLKLPPVSLCACRYCFKTSIIEKYQLRFLEGIKYCEDQLFTVLYLLCVKRIYSFNEILYFYEINETSVMSKAVSYESVMDHIKVLEKILHFYKESAAHIDPKKINLSFNILLYSTINRMISFGVYKNRARSIYISLYSLLIRNRKKISLNRKLRLIIFSGIIPYAIFLKYKK